MLFRSDPAIRVIVLSGAGDKAFVSGGDISKFEGQRSTPEQIAEYDRKRQRFRSVLHDVGKPTIAMIRGYCLGGGMAIALNCDMRFCSEDAKFGVPAARLSIGYAAEGLAQLLALTGPALAKQIMFTGARYDARTALRMGLVNDVYPAAELEQKVNELCEVIANNAPLSILSSKRVLDELVKDADKRELALCQKVVADCFASQDYIEGRRAFMEKRRPVFTGK